MNVKNLEDIKNPRVRRFKDKTLMFAFETMHIPGKNLLLTDAVSRNPVSEAGKDEDSLEEVLSEVQYRRVAEDKFRSSSWEEVREAATLDDTSIRLNTAIRQGFPDNIADLEFAWNKREGLYSLENVPMFGDRMFVPEKLRGTILDSLHSAHQGASTMTRVAEDRFFWPHMGADIQQKRDQCRACDQMAPSQSYEESLPADSPSFPFDDMAVDFFSDSGLTYVALCDRYSGFLSIAQMESTAFEPTARFMREHFQRFGVPTVVESDGGPPFNSHEWRKFLESWHIRHRLSSAMYPQSNSRAES